MSRSVFLGLVISLLIITSCSSAKNGTGILRDGSSFEKAIIVKSVNDEYEYVRRVCPECRLTMQSLVFNNKKPYDILEFENGSGETVSYYFDISRFFGKGF